MTKKFLIITIFFLLTSFFSVINSISYALTLTPNTWNIIGLDSNSPATGPNRFPVGAKVCGGTPGANQVVTFNWDTGGTDNGTYIYLRPGSANPITITFGADGCADAFFEVEVAKNSLAFDKTRRYYISAGSDTTPRPRELYVEHLVSQARNYITDVKLNGVSIPAGGSMNLMVGNTYTIQLYGGTATQGYNQFEMFINFSNTIFQILSVSTNYSANTSPYVSTTNHKYLYADACLWENDPNSPYYLSCWYDYKAGGSNVVTTYVIKVISGAGTSETLSTLLYDFSGSSYHYNADYSTGGRIVNVYGPASITINKSFTPKTIYPNDTSTMSFTINNPTSETVSGVNFTDTFPSGLTVASTPNVTYTGCGGGTFSPSLTGGETSLNFINGVINANSSCQITLNVTAGSTGTYNNTTGPLYINTNDNTGNTGSDSLIVSTTPAPPSSCGTPVTLATWTMPTTGQGSGGPPPPYTTKASDVSTATANSAGGTSIISTSGNPANSWQITGGWNLATNRPYFEFTVDTSKYGGVSITFDYYFGGSPGWNAPNDSYIISSKADNGSFSTEQSYTATKGKWTTSTTYYAPTTGSSTTTFRITGSQANGANAFISLDNIIIQGCQRPNPPNISKSFSPTSIALNGTSTLTFTITNPNPTLSLNGISFTDTLPSGLSISTSSSTVCNGGTLTTNSATKIISLTGASLAGSASCSFSVTVTGSSAGQHTNISGNVSSTQSGPNSGGANVGYGYATITVIAPPVFSKAFSPTAIFTGENSTLSFTITNPNTVGNYTNIAFTDTLPTGLTVANSSTSQCSGTLTTTSPSTISFSGGSLTAGNSCTFSVTVTGTTTGTKNNTSGNITALSGTVNLTGNQATASIVVNSRVSSIDLKKQISTSPTGPWTSYTPVAVGGNVYYRFKVYNSGDTALYNIGITEVTGSINPSCSFPNPLNPGDEAYCYSSAITAISGTHINTAYVHGQYPNGGTTYNSANSSAVYATTGLTLTKNATETNFKVVGDIIHYTYTVTNSGYAILSGSMSVTDNKTTVTCPAINTIGDFDNYFDPGESITCSATYTITSADVLTKSVTNTAYASIGGTTSNNSSKTVTLAPADLTALKKNNTNNQVIAGNSFDWTIIIANSINEGSAVFTDTQVLLRDNLPDANVTYTLGSLTKSGVTGNINCSFSSNTITCNANGNVIIPPKLKGTIAVTNGSPTVTGTGTFFTTELSVGSIILINGVPYTVLSISNDTSLTLTTNYAGANASGISIPASFSISVTANVSTSAGSPLVNPKSGGICRADPDTVLSETNEGNNDCSDTLTVILMPSITVIKSVQHYYDPINGTNNPKTIPGGEVIYTIIVSNTGAGSVDNNTVEITDPIPANTIMCVSNICYNPPITFSCSTTPPCGLTFNLGSDVTYYDASNNVYTPNPDANGYDPLVRKIKLNPKGLLNGSTGPPHPNFTITFKVKIE